MNVVIASVAWNMLYLLHSISETFLFYSIKNILQWTYIKHKEADGLVQLHVLFEI